MGPRNRQCGDGGKAGPPPAQVVGNHPCPRGLLLNPNGFPAWIRLCIEMGLIPFTQPAKAGEVQCAVKKEKYNLRIKILVCYRWKSQKININGCLVLFKNKSGSVMAWMWTVRVWSLACMSFQTWVIGDASSVFGTHGEQAHGFSGTYTVSFIYSVEVHFFAVCFSLSTHWSKILQKLALCTNKLSVTHDSM